MASNKFKALMKKSIEEDKKILKALAVRNKNTYHVKHFNPTK